MKLEIYNEKQIEKEEKIIHFRLIRSLISEDILLTAVDEYGKRVSSGTLLKITEKGFERIESVSPEIGLPLDERKKVKFN